MKNSIPDFAGRIEPFRVILEEAYTISGKRTKASIKRIPRSTLSWTDQQNQLFRQFQDELLTSVKLSHPHHLQELRVYTDASDEMWAAVVTQCEKCELDKDISEQTHQPLAFLGDRFKGPQQHWTTFEKEAFAIFDVFQHLEYMLTVEQNIRIFTDHRNLCFVFHPGAMDSRIGRHVICKVQRWGALSSRFSYTIEHLFGDQNVMTDIMTRWLNEYRGKRLPLQRITSKLIEHDILPSQNSDLNQIISNISTSQSTNPEQAPPNISKENTPWTINRKIWVPDSALDIQYDILISCHCGHSGHRGVDSTWSIIFEQYHWTNMKQDCQEFVSSCLHCMIGKSPNRIPRPLSLTLHATAPKEVLHFDYLYIGPATEGQKYVLVLKDDLSSYVWFIPSRTADSDPVASAIHRWIRTFTVIKHWVSDQGSHFKNEVLETLAQDYKIRQNFTIAYFPWINGTVERVMSQLQSCYKCLMSDLKLGPQDWPSVLDLIQSILNESPLRRLGSRADGTFRTPLEVTTGIQPVRNVFFPSKSDSSSQPTSIYKAKAIQKLEIPSMQEALNEMHKDVENQVSKNRESQIRQHNKRTNIKIPSFEIGDFVLVRKGQDKGHKQMFKWTGPKPIVSVLGDTVYILESLYNQSKETVHASRMILYRAQMNGKEVSEQLIKQAQHTETKYEIIEKLQEFSKIGKDKFSVLVKWAGLHTKLIKLGKN